MVWIVGFMKGNAKECLKDPVGYFEAKNEGAVCNCYKQGNLQYNSGLGFKLENYSFEEG